MAENHQSESSSNLPDTLGVVQASQVAEGGMVILSDGFFSEDVCSSFGPTEELAEYMLGSQTVSLDPCPVELSLGVLQSFDIGSSDVLVGLGNSEPDDSIHHSDPRNDPFDFETNQLESELGMVAHPVVE